MLPFASTDIVLILSSVKLTEDELCILKYGLKQPTEHKFINKTNALTTFDFIHRAMNKDLKDNRETQVK